MSWGTVKVCGEPFPAKCATYSTVSVGYCNTCNHSVCRIDYVTHKDKQHKLYKWTEATA